MIVKIFVLKFYVYYKNNRLGCIMIIREYKRIIKKYKKKYTSKLDKCKDISIKYMINYDSKKFVTSIYDYREIIKNLIKDVINEFDEFKEIECCVMINGSLARGTNTLYSDIDINYFYSNENYSKMINIEERVNYILQTILNYRGKDRIHSMVVYLPLINNVNYEFIKNNKYPIYFDDGIIYNKCRKNAEELMYATYNSTRDINNLIKYLNENDNSNNINEWTNSLELIYDNGLYESFITNRKIFRGQKNLKQIINKVLCSIKDDNNFVDDVSKIIKIKDLKYYYKILVLHNTYDVLAIYLRLNRKLKTINLLQFEELNIGLTPQFYKKFYKYLSVIQKLQYLLDNNNLDFSFHSDKHISASILNDEYKRIFNSNNIISDLNKAKSCLYKELEKNLNLEMKKYEK